MRPSMKRGAAILAASNAGRLPAGRGGFTLAELLIAIAILSVGLSMTASLFPAAMRESQRTSDDVDGTIACHNVLNIALARLTYPVPYVAASDPFQSTSLTQYTGLLGDATYPKTNGTDTPDYSVGVLLFGRHVISGTNDYQLILVAYRNTGGDTSTAIPWVTPTTGTIADCQADVDASLIADQRRGQITFSDNTDVKVGSPVLVRADGTWARIVEINGNIAILDHNRLTAGTNQAVYVISEKDVDMPLSPATTVLVTRTALRE